MKAIYMLLILCFYPMYICYPENTETLAPFPYYPAIGGKPAKSEIIVDGQKYTFGWDGKQMYFFKGWENGPPRKHGNNGNGNFGGNNEPPGNPRLIILVLILVPIGLAMWYFIIKLILKLL